MYNKVVLIGRLGSDVELKHVKVGEETKAVAKFSLATDRGYGDKKKTDWHNIVVWDKKAENVAKYLGKGSTCSVEGAVTQRSWEKDGTKHYMTEIIASDVVFLSKKETSQEHAPVEPVNPDYIPF